MVTIVTKRELPKPHSNYVYCGSRALGCEGFWSVGLGFTFPSVSGTQASCLGVSIWTLRLCSAQQGTAASLPQKLVKSCVFWPGEGETPNNSRITIIRTPEIRYP